MASSIIVLASLAGTVWLLDAPGRIWPWFPVVVAAWGAVALAVISTHIGTPAAIQAAVVAFIIGGTACYAGVKFGALGYTGLYWLCLGIAGVHALNVAIRAVLACLPGVDSGKDKGDHRA